MLLISHVFSEMSRLTDNLENATNDASYRRQVYEAGYSPICPVLFMPTFLKDDAPAEVKDRQEMSDEPAQALPHRLYHAQRHSRKCFHFRTLHSKLP